MLSVRRDLELEADALAEDAIELVGDLECLLAVLAEEGLAAVLVDADAASVHLEDRALQERARNRMWPWSPELIGEGGGRGFRRLDNNPRPL
jgi:hypothetical protein